MEPLQLFVDAPEPKQGEGHTTHAEAAASDFGSMEKLLPPPQESGLDAHEDARAVIRLIQCSVCSLPLQNPRTLPCGNSICRKCLPQLHLRQNISYPGIPSRQEGFACPFPDCEREHSAADCALDVTLSKVLEIVDKELGSRSRSELSGDTALVAVTTGNGAGEYGYTERKWVMYGGRLAAIYKLSKMGELEFGSEVTCIPLAGDSDSDDDECDLSYLDYDALRTLKDATMADLECQVCYGTFLDPVTTYCGHTFCRGCLERVLDLSRHCPACRRLMHLPSVLPAKSSNKRLTRLLLGLCPEIVAQRAIMAVEEMVGPSDGGLTTPIFVFTSSFPGMPTPLHVFEPRYMLMIRRVCENGTRRFGMLLPNSTGQPQGNLGVTPFMQYGTMLHIEHLNVYPDGRSDIWTVGISRFKVKRWAYRDEYIVANVERVDDIPILEEEAREALETSPRANNSLPPPPPTGNGQAGTSRVAREEEPWARLPTRALLQIGHDFVDHMSAVSAPWMHENHVLVFGERPEDPAIFPFWLASALPLKESEKYRILCSTSVRERLKIVVGWIREFEDRRWYLTPLPSGLFPSL